MTTFNQTRNAAGGFAGATQRRANLVRSHAEDMAELTRRSQQNQEGVARDAQNKVQALGARTADVVFNNDMRAAEVKARADGAIGELINNLGTSFATTAQRVFEAQADANIAEQKKEFRQKGVVDGLGGGPRDSSAPKAYQDAYSESAASVAAFDASTVFQTEVLSKLSSPQEIRDAAHKFLTEKSKGMDDPVYREYFSAKFLEKAIPMARVREGEVRTVARGEQNRIAIGGALARLGDAKNEQDIHDIIETAHSAFAEEDKHLARPQIIRAMLLRASDEGKTAPLVAHFEKLGYDNRFPEAMQGFKAKARQELLTAHKQGITEKVNSLAPLVSKITANIDNPTLETAQELGQLTKEMAVLAKQGGSTVDRFNSTLKTVLDLENRLKKSAPKLASWMNFQKGIGTYSEEDHGVYANKAAQGLLADLDMAIAAPGDGELMGDDEGFGAEQQFALAKENLTRFMGSLGGNLPKSITGRINNIFDGINPQDGSSREQQDADFKQDSLYLGVFLDALRDVPASEFNMTKDIPKENQFLFRALQDKVFLEGASPEEALRSVHNKYTPAALAKIASFDPSKTLNGMLTRSGGGKYDAYAEIAKASDSINLYSGSLREEFMQDVLDEVRFRSLGYTESSLPTSAVKDAIEKVKGVYEKATVSLPVLGDDGEVTDSGILIQDRNTRALLTNGNMGKTSKQIITGYFEDYHETLTRIGGEELGFDAKDLAIFPVMAGDGTFGVRSAMQPAGVFIPLRTDEDVERVKKINEDLDLKNSGVFFAYSDGGNTAELRVKIDPDRLPADREAALKQLQTREARRRATYGDGSVDTLKRIYENEAEQETWEDKVRKSLGYTEFLGGFIKLGNPPEKSGDPEVEVDEAVPDIKGAVRNDDFDSVTSLIEEMRFKTQGDLKSEDAAGTLREVATSAVEGLQEKGLINQTVGLTSLIPDLPDFQSVLQYLDDLMENFQMRQNGGIPIDPTDTSPDQSYRAMRRKEIFGHEGFRRKPYLDTEGKLTIGAGINLDAPHNASFMRKAGWDIDAIRNGSKELTDEQLDILLDFNLNEAEQIVSNKVKVPLTTNQRISLVSLVFNGGGGMLGPRLTGYVNTKDWQNAENEIRRFSNAKKHKGIQNRRNREADRFAMDTHEPSEAHYFN